MSAQPTQPARPLRVRRVMAYQPPEIVEELSLADPPGRRDYLQLELAYPAPTRPALTLVRGRSSGHDDDAIGWGFGPQPTRTADLPEPTAWAGRMGLAAIEVARGVRPAQQLMRWTSPPIFASLVRRQMRAVRRGRAIRRPLVLRRVTCCHPRDGIVEATVVVHDGGQVRALALRLEGQDHRWVISALELG